jgi:hypothetical protein
LKSVAPGVMDAGTDSADRTGLANSHSSRRVSRSTFLSSPGKPCTVDRIGQTAGLAEIGQKLVSFCLIRVQRTRDYLGVHRGNNTLRERECNYRMGLGAATQKPVPGEVHGTRGLSTPNFRSSLRFALRGFFLCPGVRELVTFELIIPRLRSPCRISLSPILESPHTTELGFKTYDT